MFRKPASGRSSAQPPRGYWRRCIYGWACRYRGDSLRSPDRPICRPCGDRRCLRSFRGVWFWVCLFSAAYLCVCLSLLVPGQYAAVWRSLTSARVSNRGHHAAELGCGRLRRCPVIRPATDRGMRDIPYDRRRTLTAAYRAGACLSLDDFPAVSSQRFFTQPLFLDLRRIDFGALSFPAVSRRWQVPRQKR